jgi:TRAP-type C4-dicarboxylate transport system permease small subunit
VSHGFQAEAGAQAVRATPANAVLAGIAWLLDKYSKAMVFLSMIALVATSLILTYSVVVRYFLRIPTDWQDEVSVFMLVGVIFLCSAHVQSLRGHIGIEALAGYLSPKVNRIRMLVIDLASCAFCAFFTWKSWTLLHEAWVDGQTTSSTFGAPLWIPYSMMAVGMTMLTLQLLVQALTGITGTLQASEAA